MTRFMDRLGRSLIHMVNRGGGFLSNSRLRAVDFDIDRLMQDAVARAGSDDFGSPDFIEPLRTLLDAYQREADLTLIGRIAMREDALQSLVTRLQLHADRRRYPELAGAEVRAPVFIMGLPRSGTTFLHNLLSQDPAFRAPAGWEVMYPSPPPGQQTAGDPRIGRAQRRMQQLYWLAPEFRVIHPLDALEPQECIAITASAFASDVYPTMCDVPSYQHWLDHADLVPSYRYHRMFLQQLQAGQAGLRWLLKAPAHLFSLDALFEVYPDARIVFTHRDPLQVLPSLSSLTLVLRGAFSDRHDPAAIGREISAHWAEGIRRARHSMRVVPERAAACLEVDYDDLVADPLDVVERLYHHIGMEPGDGVLSRMQRYLQARPKDRFGKHRYSLQQFELDAEQIRRDYQGLDRYIDQNAGVDEKADTGT